MSKSKKAKAEQVAKEEPDENAASKGSTTGHLEDAPMFAATISDVRHLIQVMSMISSLMDLARLDVKQDGLYVRGMDPSHVALIDVHVPTDAFVSYTVDREGVLVFPPSELIEILGTMPKGKEVSLTGTDVENRQIMLSSGSKHSATMRLYTEGISDCPLPKTSWQADITMDRNKLMHALSNIQAISEYVHITIYKNGLLEFYGEGDKGNRKIGFDEEIDVNYCDGTEKAQVILSLDYLMSTLRKSTSQYATLRIADSNPMCVSLSAFDIKSTYLGTTPIGKIDFYMAPRVES